MSDREKKIRGGGARNDKLYNKRSTRPTYPGIYIRTVSIVKRYFGHLHVYMYTVPVFGFCLCPLLQHLTVTPPKQCLTGWKKEANHKGRLWLPKRMNFGKRKKVSKTEVKLSLLFYFPALCCPFYQFTF